MFIKNGQYIIADISININKDIDFSKITQEDGLTYSIPIDLKEHDTSNIEIETLDENNFISDNIEFEGELPTIDDINEVYDKVNFDKTEFILFCNLDNNGLDWQLVCTVYTQDDNYCEAFEVEWISKEEHELLNRMVGAYDFSQSI